MKEEVRGGSIFRPDYPTVNAFSPKVKRRRGRMGIEEVRGRASCHPNMEGDVSNYHPPLFVGSPRALHFQGLICTFLSSSCGHHIE